MDEIVDWFENSHFTATQRTNGLRCTPKNYKSLFSPRLEATALLWDQKYANVNRLSIQKVRSHYFVLASFSHSVTIINNTFLTCMIACIPEGL